MRVIGDPERGRGFASASASRVEVVAFEQTLIDRFSAFVGPQTVVGDFGASTREALPVLEEKARLFEVLDIEGSSGRVDVVLDLCQGIPADLEGRYDAIFCSSVLEHVYDPFRAASNLLLLLRPGGVLMGSAPWLFPYHPSPGRYEDFWRFSPTAYGVLFSDASRVMVSPTRGRLSTALLVLSMRYKYVVEKRFPRIGKTIARLFSSGQHEFQTSAFDFEVHK